MRLRLIGLALLAGCGGTTVTTTPPPPPPPPPPPAVASVTLSRDTATVVPRQTTQLSATLKDQSGATLSGRTVSWTTSAAGVATVTADGAVAGVAVGTASITATSEGRSASASITVRDGAVVGPTGGVAATADSVARATFPASALSGERTVTITQVANPPANPRLIAGTAFDFGPSGTFALPVTIRISYRGSVVPVTALAHNLRLHRLSGTTWTEVAGSVVDTAAKQVAGPTSSFSSYAIVETVPPVAVIAISPPAAQLVVGSELQLTATPKDAAGSPLERPVTWETSAPVVATVSTAGLVTGLTEGAGYIRARTDGRVDSVPLTVSPRSTPATGTVVLGSLHTCALTSEGSAYCWGTNDHGELGTGTTTDRGPPTAVTGGLRFRMLAAAGSHTCGLTLNAQVWCWGSNFEGELGDGTQTQRTAPVRVPLPETPSFLATGDRTSCAATISGAVYCWGDRLGGTLIPIGQPRDLVPAKVPGTTPLRRLAVGLEWACGTDDAGRAYCWGQNSFGIGTGVAGGSLDPRPVITDERFDEISLGLWNACAVAKTRVLWCWGRGLNGVLGNGDKADRELPTAVAGSVRFRTVSAGTATRVCASSVDYQPYCWGNGVVGDGTEPGEALTPRAVAGGPMPVLATGTSSSCGIDPTGVLSCWGTGASQLGTVYLPYNPGPADLPPAGVAFRSLSSQGVRHCATTTGDQVYCWGGSDQALSPSLRNIGVAARQVAVGTAAACVLDPLGKAHCWGDNAFGQLGNGTTTASPTTAGPVTGGLTFTALDAGGHVACGLTGGGELYCWGQAASGGAQTTPALVGSILFRSFRMVGSSINGVATDGTLRQALLGTAPTQDGAATDWLAHGGFGNLSIQLVHYCALKAGGSAWCRGDNRDGQLGNGTASSGQPTIAYGAVAGGQVFRTIQVGGGFTCGLTATDDAYCWGVNQTGYLGDGTKTSRAVPTKVSANLKYSVLEVGTFGACGIGKTDSKIYCWGSNTGGRLGLNWIYRYLTPRPVSGNQLFRPFELPM